MSRSYWLDPARDYVVVRRDQVSRGEPGNEEVVHTQLVEEFARSPQGVWFATRVRRKGCVSSEATTSDSVECFYVDFNANLPDALFEPPRVGTRGGESQ